MALADFVKFVDGIGERVGFPKEKVLLQDHLGPNPWKGEPKEEAMAKAEALVRVCAGWVHSRSTWMPACTLEEMGAGVFPDPTLIAERTARLCQVAEEGYRERLASVPHAQRPVYIIGTEVPVPGGSMSENEGMNVTAPEDFHATVRLTREAFSRHGLEAAWPQVVGVVVQPGVEFGDDFIQEYNRAEAQELSRT